MRLVIIGGSDAGISAALRARELAPEADISVVLADKFSNYSTCPRAGLCARTNALMNLSCT